MITMLLRVLGYQHARPMRRTLTLMTITSHRAGHRIPLGAAGPARRRPDRRTLPAPGRLPAPGPAGLPPLHPVRTARRGGPDADGAGAVHRGAGSGGVPRARRTHRGGRAADGPGAGGALRGAAAVAGRPRRQTARRSRRTGQARRTAAHRAAAAGRRSRGTGRPRGGVSSRSPSGTASTPCSTTCRCPSPRGGGWRSQGRPVRARAPCSSCSHGSTTWTRARCASAAWTYALRLGGRYAAFWELAPGPSATGPAPDRVLPPVT